MSNDEVSNAVQVLERRDLDLFHTFDISRHHEVASSLPWDGDKFQFLQIKAISRSLPDNKSDVERYMMEDILSGLHGLGVPFIYLIIGTRYDVKIYLGILNKSGPKPSSSFYLDTLSSSLRGTFPDIETQNLSNTEINKDIFSFFHDCRHYGIMTGIPTAKLGIEKHGIEQIERLIRGLYRQNFGYMVVSEPVEDLQVVNTFDDVANLIKEKSSLINETTQYTKTSRLTVNEDTLNRSVQYYVELLEVLLDKLKLAKAQGMWRVMPYFFSPSPATAGMMRNLLKTVFSGDNSIPEAIRTIEIAGGDPVTVLSKFRQLELKLNFHPSYSVDHPLEKILKYKFLSALTSRDLATFTHLPKEEMPGYDVKDTARFGVCMPEKNGFNQINIGEILDRGAGTGNLYTVSANDLVKHGLIAGVTGCGKTNTCLNILHQLWTKSPKIPFLVIEPAKAEYRDLMDFDGFQDLQIFTLGDEITAPFRLNPFELIEGVKLQTHIDNLKAVFNASFVMYSPMPHVLEKCIHEIYEDKGWDLITNKNIFEDTQSELPHGIFPTLTDLYNKIDSVVEELGYEERLTMDITAGLKSRVGSMRIGGKGSMLDTAQSIPMDILLTRPTILELQNIGDDEEKAFIIGLLIARLYEYREVESKKSGSRGKLKHLTLIEEAHRLLGKASSDSENLESVNVKGKSVETFCNILSEIRAFGESIFIAEQIPAKLAQDAIKNTNLKIMHRIVAQDDRDLLGQTMNLNDDQNKFIAIMGQGEAAVFSEGFSEPFLVRIPYFPLAAKKLHHRKTGVLDKDVSRFMAKRLLSFDHVFGKHAGCRQCQSKCTYRDTIYSILAKKEFQQLFTRYYYAILEKGENLVLKYPQVREALIVERPSLKGDEINDLLFCFLISAGEQLLSKKAVQHHLRSNNISSLMRSYFDMINSFFTIPVKTQLSEKTNRYLLNFQTSYKKAFKVKFGPFPGCDEFCKTKCLFRYDVSAYLRDDKINDAMKNALTSGNNEEKKVQEICRNIAKDSVFDDCLKFSEGIVLCFFIQKSIQWNVKNILLNIKKWIVDVSEEVDE